MMAEMRGRKFGRIDRREPVAAARLEKLRARATSPISLGDPVTSKPNPYPQHHRPQPGLRSDVRR